MQQPFKLLYTTFKKKLFIGRRFLNFISNGDTYKKQQLRIVNQFYWYILQHKTKEVIAFELNYL